MSRPWKMPQANLQVKFLPNLKLFQLSIMKIVDVMMDGQDRDVKILLVTYPQRLRKCLFLIQKRGFQGNLSKLWVAKLMLFAIKLDLVCHYDSQRCSI